MDEDKFNISVRKFLKVVGITAQREIERAVREASSVGRLQGDENLKAKMTLEIQVLGVTHGGRWRHRARLTARGVRHQQPPRHRTLAYSW
jgi:hypothetical protein